MVCVPMELYHGQWVLCMQVGMQTYVISEMDFCTIIVLNDGIFWSEIDRLSTRKEVKRRLNYFCNGNI